MENIQAVISQKAGTITCNFEQVAVALNDRLKEYEGAVFTEDSKTLAKKVVASLRAEKKSFQDNLRDAKRTYMAPWETFEAQAKALIALYDKPIGLIDGQVKAFEKKRIAEKRELIGRLYQENVPEELQEYLTRAQVYNPKWENAGTREKAIREEIQAAVKEVSQALMMIREMKSDAVEAALTVYKNNLNLSEAVAYINKYERQKAEILAQEQERRRQEEAERICREERERIAAEQKAEAEKEALLRQAEAEKEAAVEQAREVTVHDFVDSLTPELEGETALYSYQMRLTADAKQKLEMYLDSVGIDYETEEITGW